MHVAAVHFSLRTSIAVSVLCLDSKTSLGIVACIAADALGRERKRHAQKMRLIWILYEETRGNME
jgi:hypothetical protein